MDELKDSELVKHIAQGNKDAFDVLLVRHYKKAYRYLMRLLGNEKDVDDLMQEGFMAIWQKADTFKEGAHFNPWFYTIFYHLFIDYIRRHKHAELPLIIDPASDENIENQLQKDEIATRLKVYVNKLPDNERHAFILFYYQQQKIKDISRVLELSEQAVESILYRTRKKLKSYMKGD